MSQDQINKIEMEIQEILKKNPRMTTYEIFLYLVHTKGINCTTHQASAIIEGLQKKGKLISHMVYETTS